MKRTYDILNAGPRHRFTLDSGGIVENCGRGPQPTNLPKSSVEYESSDILVQDLCELSNDEINKKYGSLMKAASSAIRMLIKAPKGNSLYGADYASIEARITFWLAGCNRGLKSYRNGIDLYKELASLIYKIPYTEIDSDQRFVGKTGILGFSYGLGYKGFINTCLNFGVTIEESLAQKATDTYRETYYEVPEAWASLDKASMLAMTTGRECFACKGRISFKLLRLKNKQLFLYMKLPSGRLIAYPQAKIDIVVTPWGAKKKAITFRKLINNHWSHESTYGAKLFENAVQAIARDVMYKGMDNVSKAGFNVIMQVYDEAISYAPTGFMSLEDYENLLCGPMDDWAKGIPLEAEGKILTRYSKL